MSFSLLSGKTRLGQVVASRVIRLPRSRLDVEIGDAEGVGLDKVAAGLDEITHKGREGLLGRIGVADLDLEKRADLGGERSFPQLIGVHLAQPFVALDIDAAAAQL